MSNRITYITQNAKENEMRIVELTEGKALVTYRNRHYVVSDNGSETLIFDSDSNGTVSNYIEVGGARSVTLSEVLSDFQNFLFPF